MFSYCLEIFHSNLDIRYGIARLLFALIFDTRIKEDGITPVSCRPLIDMSSERNVVVPSYVHENYHLYGSTSVQLYENRLEALQLFAANAFKGWIVFELIKIDDDALAKIIESECIVSREMNCTVLEYYEGLVQTLKTCTSHREFSSALMQLSEWTISPFEIKILENYKLFDIFKRFDHTRLMLDSYLLDLPRRKI
jgi:hypothetical protein